MRVLDYIFLIGLAMFIKGGLNDTGEEVAFMMVAIPVIVKMLDALDEWWKEVAKEWKEEN